MNYRLNQRLCKVCWRKGIPYLAVRTVTKVTRTTYYVGDAKKASVSWSTCWTDAITEEYRDLIQVWTAIFGQTKEKEEALRKHGWTYDDTVRCICHVRRLENKIRKRKHHIRS